MLRVVIRCVCGWRANSPPASVTGLTVLDLHEIDLQIEAHVTEAHATVQDWTVETTIQPAEVVSIARSSPS